MAAIKNPFSISFGRKPYQYIERGLLIDEITEELESDIIQNQCFMITGVRGSGKTVTLTDLESRLRKRDDWLVVGLTTERDMLKSLTAKLYDSNKFLRDFFETEINLSAFGIGVSIKNVPPVADIESALEMILKEIKRRGKRLLVTVDEVYNTPSMKEFAASFQLLIRQELPVFLIMAGLYDNVHNLEDEKNLTFLYRAPKYIMEPLNLRSIELSYIHALNIDQKYAAKLAKLTKGYPFAYQALGRYIWESEEHRLTDEVMLKYDLALETYVYRKMWEELSGKDRWYLKFIVKKDPMSTAELLELSGSKKNEFSQYRSRLSDRGIIDTGIRGQISLRLPRFAEFVERQYE